MCDSTAATAKIKSGKKHPFTVYKFEVKEFTDHRKNKSSAVDPVSTTRDPRWLYVFKVESWGVRIRYEARIDGKNKYKLVDWKTSSWHKKDTRPPKKTVKELSILGKTTEAAGEGIYAFLSRIQIPYSRLRKYIGNKTVNPYAASLVQRRSTKLFSTPGKTVDVSSGKYTLYLNEPITLADRVSAEFAISCRTSHRYKEKNQLKYNLALAALNACKEVLKKEEDFVKDGNFKEKEARKVVSTYEKKEKKLKNLREAAGKRFAWMTGTAEYDEALKDHDGVNSLEEEAIRIKARHTTNKMQSQATQNQMERELNDVNSWVNNYLKSTTLFNSGRKFTAMGAEFGDILGEYAHIWYVTFKDKKGWISKVLPASVNNRLGLSIAPYIGTWKAGMFGPGRVYRINVNGLAKAMGDTIAKRVLVVFEAINLTMAWDSFEGNKKKRAITDYAGPVGALCDLAGAVGSRVASTIEKKERDAALAAGKSVFKQSKKLVVLTRVMAVIGLVGGICDMIEARSGALDAAKTLNLGRVVGFTAMYMGAAIGVHIAAMAALGLETGPFGLIAVGLVIIGILIIHYFKESELETWLRTCQWGKDYLGAKMDKQLKDLDYILAKFTVTPTYLDLTRDAWGVCTATKLQVLLKSGFVHARSRFTIEIKTMVREKTFLPSWKLVTIYKGSSSVKIGADGKVKPINFVVNLVSPDLRARKLMGFRQDIRIDARLDLDGNGKIKVPKKKKAFWAFHFDISNKKFNQTNAKFE